VARKIILADASPLIGLARVGGLPWLRKLYRSISITKAVRSEAQRLGIAVTGTVGIVAEARRAGLITAARPVFARLADEGFHLGADLLQGILIELGED